MNRLRFPSQHPAVGFKRPRQDYERYCWFDGGKGDEDVRLHKQRIVRLRKPQQCAGLRQELYQHPLNAGSYALRETALVDGRWGQCYLCVDCMDGWFDEINWDCESEVPVE